MTLNEPRYYKTTKVWAWQCEHPSCHFSVVSPRESEVRSNAALHNERKHP